MCTLLLIYGWRGLVVFIVKVILVSVTSDIFIIARTIAVDKLLKVED